MNSGEYSGSFRILCMLEDSQSEFWVGTNKGLLKYDRINGKFLRVQGNSDNLKQLASSVILDILEDTNSILWIGTESGLYKRKLINKN